MGELRLRSRYDPYKIPAQQAFRTSQAFIRGYGGAMGGGKSRALCEEALDLALENPGIPIVMVRLRHNSITETTKKTMMEYVMPPELIERKRESGGEDYIKLWNGSIIHFIGLDDPVKWFSSELGAVMFDEAHELPEESVTKLMSRLRHPKAPNSIWRGEKKPGKACLAFNPDNPSHWLYQWFLAGADPTDFGTYKEGLMPTQADDAIGDGEFFFASAFHNPFLPQGYLSTLKGQKDYLKRRYLDGLWEFVGGACWFDEEALESYRKSVSRPKYRFDFLTRDGGFTARQDKIVNGKIRVFEEPKENLAYAIGADVASGRGKDYSAAYVIRLDRPQIVAEFHGKIDSDLFAEQLHFLGRFYGKGSGADKDALLAVENQGGWGEPVVISLRDGRGARAPYPNLYQHVHSSRADLPVSQTYGMPMIPRIRALVLNQLAKAIRERDFRDIPEKLLSECLTFAEHDSGTTPRAMENCNDDCVMAAAIALEMFRLKGHHPARAERIERKRATSRAKRGGISVKEFALRYRKD